MRLHELHPPAGSKRPRRRVGRGNSAGQGTTAGKGTKGQKARSGGVKSTFRGVSSREQRYAKARGFTNIFKMEYRLIKIKDLDRFDAGATVDVDTLRDAGLIKGRKSLPVKLLGDGEITKPLTVRLDKVTQSARRKVEEAGGRIEEIAHATSST
jgi:large subunit ribosomal protein L15